MPPKKRAIPVFHLLEETWDRFSSHGDLLAAAMSYYALLSIAPLGIMALSLAGLVYEEQYARAELLGQLEKVTSVEVARSVSDMLELASKGSAKVATAVATVMLMWAASRLFVQVQDALNWIWGVRVREPQKRSQFFKEMLIKRLVSVGMVLLCGVLLLATLLVQTVLDAIGERLPMLGELSPALLALQQACVAWGVLTLLFAAIYRILPDAVIRWGDVWFGAALTGLLMLIGTWGLSVYLGSIAPGWLQGAVGAIAVFMVWAYYLALVFLLGASFTRSWAERHGHPLQVAAHAESVPPE